MKKIERKDFLKITGGAVVGAAAGTVFSGAPFLGLQWLFEWTQDQYVPAKGRETFLKTICEACPEKCQMSIRMISDRAVMINTSNQGCPFSQNALQLLYHPERVDAPLKRVGKKGSSKYTDYSKVSWEEALKDISAKMNKLIKDKKGNLIAGINGEPGLSSKLLKRLIESAGSGNVYCGSNLHNLNKKALGGHVEYNFNNADYILSFGARLVEGWGSMCSMNKSLADWKNRGKKVVQIDTICTRTASMADEWINIKPGTELYMALGIANYLINKKAKRSGGAGFAGWSKAVKEYTPEAVSSLTGVPAEKIVETAEAFSRARNPVAVAGRGGQGVSSSAAELIAVYALNDLVNSKSAKIMKCAGLGNVKLTADALEAAKAVKPDEKINGLDEFIKKGAFEMLFVNGADPVYKSVLGKDLIEKMKKAFVVSVTPLINDTAMYADYILPTLSFLEEDTSAGKAPLKAYEKARHAGDALIGIARKVEAASVNFPWKSYVDLIKGMGQKTPVGKFAFKTEALTAEVNELKKTTQSSSEYPLYMIPMEVPFIGDGDGMAFPYVLKTIGRKTFTDGKMWVHINRKTADKNGVCEGEKIDIISSRGEIGSVRAHLTDTIAPDVVAVPLGFGHNAYTKYAMDKGYNPKEIMSDTIDPVTGTANWWMTKVKIS